MRTDNPQHMTFADAIAMRRNDPTRPNHRPYEVSALNKTIEWAQICCSAAVTPTAESLRFSVSAIEDIYKTLSPLRCRISKKRLQNAQSACRGLAIRYCATDRIAPPELLPPAAALLARIEDPRKRIYPRHILRLASMLGVPPPAVDDGVAAHLSEYLTKYSRSKDRARVEILIRREWNRCVTLYPWWPRNRLTVPRARPPRWGKPWAELPASLSESVAEASQNKTAQAALFDRHRRFNAAADTIDGWRESCRIAASSLLHAGVDPQALRSVRDLCKPEAHRRAIAQLVARVGNVTRYVSITSSNLLAVAKRSGCLSDAELAELIADVREVENDHAQYKKQQPDHSQEELDRFDDPALVDAFLALPTLTVRSVQRSRRPLSIRNAQKIELALMFLIWACGYLRLKNMRLLCLEEHFFKIKIKGRDRIIVRVPGRELKGTPTAGHEFYLTDAAAELLDSYLTDFRPLIMARNRATRSEYLFPGLNGRAREASGVRQKVKRYIADAKISDRFHPHFMRKLMPKIVLDIDPTAIEIVRRAGGWQSLKMLYSTYAQKTHRVSQERHNQLLEARQLSALANLSRSGKGRK